jgi:trehalose 6-phosphate synthase/phosphatase
MLQCDLVGFHLFEYARNFILTCHRLLGLDYEFSRGGYLGVNNHGKTVTIRVSHAGIDERFIEDVMKTSTYRRLVKAFKTQITQFSSSLKEAPTIISSVDTYHPITGVKNKLYAY